VFYPVTTYFYTGGCAVFPVRVFDPVKVFLQCFRCSKGVLDFRAWKGVLEVFYGCLMGVRLGCSPPTKYTYQETGRNPTLTIDRQLYDSGKLDAFFKCMSPEGKPMNPNNSKDSAGDFAKHAGKQAAKKTAGKVAETLVSWLKKVLWQKPIEYIKLKGKKYLKVAGSKSKGKARIVAESDVPSKYQRKISEKLRGVAERPQGSVGSRSRKRNPKKDSRNSSSKGSSRESMGKPATEPRPDPRRSRGRPRRGNPSQTGSRKPQWKKDAKRERRRDKNNSRPHRDGSVDPGRVVDEEMEKDELPAEVKKQLEDASPEVVAELAAKDQRIRSYVLKNPELVDASSRKEAAQKIEIMGGAGVSKLPDFSMGHGSGDLEGMLDDLGPEWGARLGYNEMGDQLTDAVNQAANGSDGNGSDGDGEGTTSAGTASDFCGTGSGSTSISSTSGGSSGNSGGASNGVGNSGGAGNGFGSGSGSSGGGSK